MTTELLTAFERALQKRNALLVRKLRPGLAAPDVTSILEDTGIRGQVKPIVELYSWKNGQTIDLEVRRSGKGLFPGKAFYFPSLEMAVGHFGHFAAAAQTHPEISEGVGRYFPMFWDGGNSWFAIDVKASSHNRVVFIDLKSERPFREAYGSADDLIADAIGANEDNRVLRCMRPA